MFLLFVFSYLFCFFQIYCCLGALAIADSLHHVNAEMLGWWLCERQLPSGGLNGKLITEKSKVWGQNALLQRLSAWQTHKWNMECKRARVIHAGMANTRKKLPLSSRAFSSLVCNAAVGFCAQISLTPARTQLT